MPLIAAGCTLAGVAVGFVMGQRTVAPAAIAPVAEVRHDVHVDDEDDAFAFGRAFAFNWHGDHFPHPPAPPPLPGMPRQLVVDNCHGDDEACTTINKTKPDGSVVIVKSPK
jgi:hypothetical protein